MKSILIPVCVFACSLTALSQSTFAPLNKDYYNLIDRYEIRNGAFVPELHTSFKEYKRKDIIAFLDSISKDSAQFSKVDQFNIDYLYADNWQHGNNDKHLSNKPFLRHFYESKPDFYHIEEKDFRVRINPVIHWQAGKEDNNPDRLYINTRGAQIEGDIDNKISFYTFVAENQAIFPEYVGDYMRKYKVIPHEGFTKRIQGKRNSADFFTARGYFNVNATKHVDVQFGHGRQFIGNGYRSLILSDFAPDYLFLKLQTQIWKFKYTNLFTEMSAENSSGPDRVLQRKHMALHHLSFNILKNLNIGFWEAIPHGRPNGGIELQYLNPIIFYRSVEQNVGSGDNALLGADIKLNLFKHIQLYSQVTFDEFKINELRGRTGWWANKQAVQLGFKYVDIAGISNLDLQTELNYIRPYTYSHKDNFSNYSHYGQPLAHEMGANIREFIAILRYQPTNRINIFIKLINSGVGLDQDSLNWGNNILLDYRTRVKNYDNKVMQGEFVNIRKVDYTISYMMKHNLFLDFTVTTRNFNSELNANDNKTLMFGGALRWNIGQRLHDF